jgi:hypothetical protein
MLRNYVALLLIALVCGCFPVQHPVSDQLLARQVDGLGYKRYTKIVSVQHFDWPRGVNVLDITAQEPGDDELTCFEVKQFPSAFPNSGAWRLTGVGYIPVPEK